MAIARDATSYQNFPSSTYSSWTLAHTCTGTDRFLSANASERNEKQDRVTSVTYNGVSMTRVLRLAGQFDALYMYSLANPASGSNNIVFNFSPTNSVGGGMYNASYTGVDQTTPVGGSDTAPIANATSRTITLTTTVSSAWLVSAALNNFTNFAAGTNTSLFNSTGGSRVTADTNAAMGAAGNYSIELSTDPSSADITMGAFVLNPVVSTIIKTVDGVTRANVKTYLGVASASIKTINGIT